MMLQKIKLIVVFLMIFFSFSQAFGRILFLPKSFESIRLEKHLDIYESEDGKITVQELMEADRNNQSLFSICRQYTFGFTDSVIWLRFKIKNNRGISKNYYLEMDYPLVDQVICYETEKGEIINEYSVDNSDAYLERQIPHRNPVFQLMFDSGTKERTYYIRIKTRGTMRFPLILWNPVAFINKTATENIFSGLYIGLLLLLVMITVLIYVYHHRSIYLYFGLFIFNATIFFSLQSGIIFEIIRPINYVWKFQIYLSAISLSLVFLTQYVRKYMRIERGGHPVLYWMMVSSALIAFLIIVSSFLMPLQYALYLVSFLGLYILIPNLRSGLIRLFEGDRAAKFFFSGLLISMAGIFLFTLRGVGLLPTNLITLNSLDMGIMMMLMIFALGMSDGVYRINKDKLKFQKEILELNNTLERKVDERTSELKEVHDKIMQSIEYAQIIQLSALPDLNHFNDFFRDHFVIWKPKDIVGGDIYWAVKSEKCCYIALIDCTGHGVPGSLMTMSVNSILSRILTTGKCLNTAQILQHLNRIVFHTFHQKNSGLLNPRKSNWGLDISLVGIFPKKNLLTFSGAYQSLYIERGEKIEEVRGDRQGIGYKSNKLDYRFHSHGFDLDQIDAIYLSSDGYLDQLGGNKGFPYGKKRFIQTVQSCGDHKFSEKDQYLISDIEEYRQPDYLQVDDITVIGLQFKNDGK